MNLFVESSKDREKITAVLLLNAVLPGLGLWYAGGWIWAIATWPLWLLVSSGLLLGFPVFAVWFLSWFLSSVLGCGIVLEKSRGSKQIKLPGPNTRDLADSFNKGHGKGATTSALDTLEQKVKKADELLKATRQLEIENSRHSKAPRVEKYDLPEPTAIVEERPASLAHEVPHFNQGLDKLSLKKETDEVVWNSPKPSLESAPLAEANPKGPYSNFAQPEPVLPDYSSTFSTPVEQVLPQPDADSSASLEPQPSESFSSFPTPVELGTGFDFSPQPGSQNVTPPTESEFAQPQSVQLPRAFDSSQKSSESRTDQVFDFNITNAGPSDFGLNAPPNDLSFALPSQPGPGTPTQKSDSVAEEKFALEPAQTPEQVQKFFEKLGETVGTSYQQEPLSKPSFDISFPTFESPNFSFDFSSALSTDFSSMIGSPPESSDETPPKDSCKRCGVAKHADFTFCLGCGISF